MKSNLHHILSLFCILGFQFIYAQDFGKKTIKKQPVKKEKVLKKKDSILPIKETLLAKSIDSIKTDSIKKPKEAIDATITHDALDYTLQNTKNKTVTLYNKAHVIYKDIDLKAGIILINYKNNTVYAKGIKDSLGYHQRPVFRQGGQQSEQDSIIFNFKSKKAIVYGIKTVQDGIITYGEKTKRVNDSTIYMRRLRFTTSKKTIPDYYIATNKAKLVPGKKIIVGGSNLVIADVPTPLYLPFAYFPLSQERTSGFIIPTWGESRSQGFFLQNGGYYFALSDYFDLTLLGDIYTNGSWGIRTNSNYYVRYKYRGNFSFNYENMQQSIQGLSDYGRNSNFNIRWSHSRDSKASPNSNFSASVNVGSSKYYRQSVNEVNTSKFQTNTLSSSITYYQKFVNTPFSMNLGVTHSQNTNTEDITMTLPSLQISMDRINPFEGKGNVRKNAFQKIGINYSLQSEYRINTKDSLFFKPEMFRTAKTGIQHNLSASTSMKVFKYFTLSPSVSYKDVWYFDKIKKRYNPTFVNKDGTLGAIENDTLGGFTRFNDYSFNISMATNIYGTFNFKSKTLKAIRHTLRPSISYGYHPDFSENYDEYVRSNADPSKFDRYSPFENGIYGSPSSGLSNSVGITLNNVLEAKVAAKEDDKTEEDRKIMLLNNLNFSTSYNFAADSLRWSPVSASASTRLFKDKLAVNVNAILDPYQLNDKGNKIDKFNSSIFRLTNASISANYSISSKDFDEEEKEDNKNGNGAQITPDVFGENRNTTNDFAQRTMSDNKKESETKTATLYKSKIPWNLSLSFSSSYSKNGVQEATRRNSLMFSGDVEFSPKWKVGVSSGYDFTGEGFTHTSLNFSRDLDSWRFNFNWTPFGIHSYYYFFIGVKSGALSDLKWDKNKPPDRVLF